MENMEEKIIPQEVINKEAESYASKNFDTNLLDIDDHFEAGVNFALTETEKFAEKFAEWKERHAWEHMYRDEIIYTTKELIAIFKPIYKEQYGK